MLSRYNHVDESSEKPLLQVAADLLRAPPTTMQFDAQASELIIGVDLAAVLTCSSRGRSPMRIEGSILTAGRRVAPQFPRNRRRRSTEPAGNRPHAQTGTAQIGDVDALVLGQVARADLTDREWIQWRDEPDHERLALGRQRTMPRPLLHPTRRCQHHLQNLEKCCEHALLPRGFSSRRAQRITKTNGMAVQAATFITDALSRATTT